MQQTADVTRLTDEEITRIVFDGVADDGHKGDFILVLGFRDVVEDRVPKAVELYNAGRAGKIIFSGAPVLDTPFGPLSEAEHMARVAMELGVPAEDIIIDNMAKTTDENMICSLLLMQREMKIRDIRRVLIVSSPQHLKRAYHTARLFWPEHIAVTLCPAERLINAGTWPTADNGRWRRFVCHEAELLSRMEAEGFIR